MAHSNWLKHKTQAWIKDSYISLHDTTDIRYSAVMYTLSVVCIWMTLRSDDIFLMAFILSMASNSRGSLHNI